MKTPGLIGGIGPESTLAYYRGIVSYYQSRTGDGTYPRLILNIIDLSRIVHLIRSQRLEELTTYLCDELEKLVAAGAAFGALAANTPHLVFDELSKKCSLPLLSIVEETAKKAERLALGKVGLFGTKFTMRAEFYPTVFSRYGMTISVPTLEEQEFIHTKYMSELVPGVFLKKTEGALLEIAKRLRDRDEIEGLILGGTELPLILKDDSAVGIPFLDTTKIHVESIVDRMLGS